jgi:hypothetical protein
MGSPTCGKQADSAEKEDEKTVQQVMPSRQKQQGTCFLIFSLPNVTAGQYHTWSMMVLSDFAPTSSGVKADEGTAYWPAQARVRSFTAAVEGLAGALSCGWVEGPAVCSHLMPVPSCTWARRHNLMHALHHHAFLGESDVRLLL